MIINGIPVLEKELDATHNVLNNKATERDVNIFLAFLRIFYKILVKAGYYNEK